MSEEHHAMARAIRRLLPADAAAYYGLRRKSLEEAPLSFWSSPEDDRADSPEAAFAMLASDDTVLFGAFDGEELVGIAGLYRERQRKRRHKMGLWGVYVATTHRRRGFARALVEKAVAHARATEDVRWLMLAVTAAAPQARRLYEQLGFRIWGTEPEGIAFDGARPEEHHMALALH